MPLSDRKGWLNYRMGAIKLRSRAHSMWKVRNIDTDMNLMNATSMAK